MLPCECVCVCMYVYMYPLIFVFLTFACLRLYKLQEKCDLLKDEETEFEKDATKTGTRSRRSRVFQKGYKWI